MRPSRGYLLIEVMVSASLLSILLLGTLGVIAAARRDITLSSHQAVAAQVAQAKADELVALPHDTSLAAMSGTDTPVAEIAAITRTWSVANAGLQASSTPNLRASDTVLEVTVTVLYPSPSGNKTLTYKRYKRRRSF